MLIKLLIIGVILVGGGIVFANEVNQFLPITSANLLDSTDDFGKFKDETIQTAGAKVEGTIIVANEGLNNFKDSSTELLSKNINDVTESTQKGLKGIGEATNENVKKITESTQKTIFGDNKNNQKQNNNQLKGKHNDGNTAAKTDSESTITKMNDENVITKPNNENTISFETLSLSTIQLDNDSVMLQYKDTSGKTISVSVTLRTPDRELFSGVFYSSMFETFVNDATNTAYFIDLIIEHKEYGTISSSVYNPGNSPNTVINGVFTKS